MLMGTCVVALLCGGCATWSTSETPRRIAGAEEGHTITSAELDELSRAFTDRFVGLLYSVTEALKHDNHDPQQRRSAQMLLLDSATNVYDIASNADAFTRVLDLLVVTSLLHQLWADEGRALEVFGERGEALVRATSHANVEARLLAARVLSDEQLALVDVLLRDWRQDNPDMVRVSFVRFSNFAIGRGMSAASNVLAARGTLFSDIGRTGQAIDEARLMGERMFYRLKREATLLRWQAEAIKDDLIATPGLATALADLHRVADQFEKLPAHVAAERQATLDALHDSLQDVDATIASVRAAFTEAHPLLDALQTTAAALDDMFRTADGAIARLGPPDRTDGDTEADPPDIRDYTAAALQLTTAAERINETFTSLNALLSSPEWAGRIQEVNELADGRIVMVADQSRGVLNALFWRACALLGVLLAMLVLYRLICLMLSRRLERPGGQAQRRHVTGAPAEAAPHAGSGPDQTASPGGRATPLLHPWHPPGPRPIDTSPPIEQATSATRGVHDGRRLSRPTELKGT